MRKSPRRKAIAAFALAAVALLATAPQALAGTIRYTVEPSPAYTIEDNGQGIVKVTYNGCVVAGARQELRFQAVTNVSREADARWSILREEGGEAMATFVPNPIHLVPGNDQRHDIRLTFTLNDENNEVTTFRIKLDPESGEGLGEGAGIMVSIPCVVAPARSFPAPGSPGARESAPCIRIVSRTPVRRGSRNRVRTRIVDDQGRPVQGAVVRLRGAGVSLERRTNSGGYAEFVFRARRRGTVVVQTNVCEGSRRLAVLGAVSPQFTG